MPSLHTLLQKAQAAEIADNKGKKKRKEEIVNEEEEEEEEEEKEETLSEGETTLTVEEITLDEENVQKMKQIDVDIVKNSHREYRNKSSVSTSTNSSRFSGRIHKQGKIHNAHQEFHRAMAIMEGKSKIYTNHESLPNYETSRLQFHEMCPRFLETTSIDTVRSTEYSHLQESGRICLDYCGFGLFSYKQQIQEWESSSFSLSRIQRNLSAHALHGHAEAGGLEKGIYRRIMSYLKFREYEYSMVFTASRGASFKLLADAYPFQKCNRLVTMYDYESESVGMMVQQAKEKGVKVSNATFKWPSLRVDSTKLKKTLRERGGRCRGSAKGLFVFPGQSRLSGVKYSYQWMALAQKNKWHVLLDASAIGPKDMDSLALSLFSPDFIIASFYKVFAADPSGFGCLFIKNTAIPMLQDASGTRGLSGIVKLVPALNHWSFILSSDDENDEGNESEEAEDVIVLEGKIDIGNEVASFSGPMVGSHNHSSYRLPRIERVTEENDDDESFGFVSGGEEITGRASMSEEPFSGPISEPISGQISSHVYDGSTSAIRRETERDFRLLGCRNGEGLIGPSLSPILQGSEDIEYGGRMSFMSADNPLGLDYTRTESHSGFIDDEDGERDEDEEPNVICRSLDHADMLGLNKATLRLRYLINWSVRSLLQLHHPGPGENLALVHLYGPRVRFERGASIAFNLYDCHGKLLHPELVQKLADKNNISLSIGFLWNMKFGDPKAAEVQDLLVSEKNVNSVSKRGKRGKKVLRIEVLTAALSILSHFEDVYRLWMFVARFLDADFVSKELGSHRLLCEEEDVLTEV